MKRFFITTLLAVAGVQLFAQEAMLPSPDAKVLGMGGVSMTVSSASHSIYNNSSMSVFSQMPVQISSSYYGQKDYDYYAVSGYFRVNYKNLVQVGWRQYLREKGNNDMALDLGYSRMIGERVGVGIVGRYVHLKRHKDSYDALMADVSVSWCKPLDLGLSSMLRVGGKVANLGGFLNNSAYDLPMDATLGASLSTFVLDGHEVTVGADVGYIFTPSVVKGLKMSVGAEYNLMQLLQIRGGYHYGEHKFYTPSYASVGAGLRILHIRLDFAYLFAKKDTPLRNTYSISFGLDF